MGETKVKDYIASSSGFAGNDEPFDGVLSAHALHVELEMIRTGPNARIHHKPGTVFEMAALFLAWSSRLPMEDSAKLDAEWCKRAVADALTQERARVERRARNHKRAQARSRARQRQRSAGILAALPSTSTQPENPGCASPVAAEGSQAEDKFWDAVKEVAKSR